MFPNLESRAKQGGQGSQGSQGKLGVSLAEQLLTKLTNTSQFRLLSSKLSREADEKKRAEIAYKLVKRFPKQSDNFLYTLRAMLK